MIRKTLAPLFIAAMLAVVSFNVQAVATKTVTLDVQNMTCKFCPITVRKSLKKVPGVVEASASLETRTAIVIFDSAKTNVEALIKATTNAGFPSTLKK